MATVTSLFAVAIMLCPVSCRDVLPFTLELPEAISKATSHKQLESISHMGIGGLPW